MSGSQATLTKVNIQCIQRHAQKVFVILENKGKHNMDQIILIFASCANFRFQTHQIVRICSGKQFVTMAVFLYINKKQHSTVLTTAITNKITAGTAIFSCQHQAPKRQYQYYSSNSQKTKAKPKTQLLKKQKCDLTTRNKGKQKIGSDNLSVMIFTLGKLTIGTENENEIGQSHLDKHIMES